MKINNRLGVVLALAGAVLGIGGQYLIFLNWYGPALQAEAAEPGCEILLKYIMPALFDVGVLGGVLFAVSAYGFFSKAKWAFPMSVVATILALQGSWFVNVPFMAADMPPVYFTLFWPYLGLYVLLMWGVGRLPWSRTLVGMVTGMTYVFCLMNGVASLSRILTIGTPLFTAVQRLHWVAMIAMGIVTVGILIRPSEWMRILGISAGFLELVVGIPLVVATTINLGRFSLFSLGPIFSLVVLVLFVWPNLWQKMFGARESEKEITQAYATPFTAHTA